MGCLPRRSFHSPLRTIADLLIPETRGLCEPDKSINGPRPVQSSPKGCRINFPSEHEKRYEVSL